MLGVGAVSSLVVVVLGLSGHPGALPAGQLLSGLAAVGGAVALASLCRRDGRVTAFRVMFAIAGVVWGAGQLILAWEVATGTASFPALGDAVSGLAAPFAVVGLVAMPGRRVEPMQGSRLAFEATMLAAAALALLWRQAFDAVYDLGALDGVTGLVLVGAEVSIVAALFVAAVREAGAALLLVFGGTTLFVAADLVTMYQVARLETWPWTSAAIACLAWPLIALGAVSVPARPTPMSDRDLGRADRRRLVAHAVVLLSLLAVMLVSQPRLGPMDPVTVGMYLVMLAAFLGREIVRARQSGLLLERLSRLALVDPLTELHNRRSLTERLAVLSSQDGDPSDDGCPARLSVITIGLDGFKDINGRLGNAVGDRLLQEVGRQVADRCDSWGATAYRLSGDELAVLYQAAPDQAEALADTLAVLVRSAASSVRGLAPVALSASVGVAHATGAWGHPIAPPDVVIRSAQALQAAKELGRGHVVVFTTPLAARAERRAAVERRLREQVSRGGVDTHFQPVLDLMTGRMVGMEALARWTDDELGAVPPQEFVDVAESCGLIDELGWQILRRALSGYVSTGARDRSMSIGVNISTLQLRAPDFACRFAELLDGLAIPTERVIVEVTESVFMSGDGPAAENIFALADAGSPIALDDFGTGYSSLAYLARLPVRILKIDRSLTTDLHDPRTRAIVRSVTDLASALGLDTVVEGIETPELEAVARELGGGFGQGWLYAKAVPPVELPGLMDRLSGPVSPVRSTQADPQQLVRARAVGRP